MVRELVKWDYEMRSPDQAHLVVPRALEAALASPSGPVYLALPREPLSAPAPAAGEAAIVPRVVPAVPHADPAVIERLAVWIAEAERPLIIASNVGQHPGEMEALAALAERCKLPVAVQTPRFLCLPTDHPMHVGFDPGAFIAEADLILAVESDVPWMPAVKAPSPTARIVHIGVDPAFLRYPMRSFRSDLSIAAGIAPTLNALAAVLAARGSQRQQAWCKRPARTADGEAAHITPDYLSRCIGEMAGPDGIIVNEYQLRPDHCTRTRPGTYFAVSPAGGLGWSIGAALGIKLAAPDRLVVATIGDGGFVFANPTACHWAAQAHELPIVMVIFNNGRYAAVRNATMSMFASGAAGRENGLGLADLSPSPPFETVAAAHGAFTARVERPADLPGMLAAARDAVLKERRHALLNVITPY
jgi:acetolactate synthase-1/2/3 large subunit